MVSTAELPSLHLTRKALTLVEQLGFPKERFQVLVNRVDKRTSIGVADMEKLFGCKVHASLPNDYFSLHRVVTLGQPLGNDGELGKGDRKCGHAAVCGTLWIRRKAKPAPAAREMTACGLSQA